MPPLLRQLPRTIPLTRVSPPRSASLRTFTRQLHSQGRTFQHARRPAFTRLFLGLGTSSIALIGVGTIYKGNILLHGSALELAEAHNEDIAEEDDTYQPYRPLRNHSLSKLINTYVVFTLCSFPSLVGMGPTLIDWSARTSIPFVWPLTEWLIRRTFFKCFVSDDTADGSLPVLSDLSRDGIGSLLVYSVEVSDKSHPNGDKTTATTQDAKSAIHRPFVDELLHSVDVAAQFAALPSTHGATSDTEAAELAARPNRSGSTFVAIKLSGLLYDSSVLERASAAIVPREWFSAPPEPAPPLSINGKGPCGGLAIPVAALSPSDVQALKELWEVLREVANRAKQHGNVRIAVDAEYSWYQPAIDAMYEAIAAEFNRPARTSSATDNDAGQVTGPLLYNTFQAYLRRTPSHLAASLERARLNGYTLGVKLVRGAYMDVENATWSNKSVDTPPVPVATKNRAAPPEYEGWRSPIWPTKHLTDCCFDGCALRLIEEIKRDIDEGKRSGSHPKIAVILASHNTQSSLKATRRMVELGLAQPDPALSRAAIASGEKVPLVNLQLDDAVRGRIFFAQLYGMASALTARMQAAFDPLSGGSGPHVTLKYVPYGPLHLVMPYLIRRAVENGSVMSGGAAREKQLVRSEILYRLGLKH